MKTAEAFHYMSDGHLERRPEQCPKTGAVYSGEMICDALRLDAFILVPSRKHKDTSPDFAVLAKGRSGQFSPFGVAWKNEDVTGAVYISIRFQHAKALPQGMLFNAWPDEAQPKDAKPGDEPAFYSVKWSRPPRAARVATNDNDFAGMVGGIA